MPVGLKNVVRHAFPGAANNEAADLPEQFSGRPGGEQSGKIKIGHICARGRGHHRPAHYSRPCSTPNDTPENRAVDLPAGSPRGGSPRKSPWRSTRCVVREGRRQDCMSGRWARRAAPAALGRCCPLPNWSVRRNLGVRAPNHRTPSGRLSIDQVCAAGPMGCAPLNNTGVKMFHASCALAQMSTGFFALSRCRNKSVANASLPAAPAPGGGPTRIWSMLTGRRDLAAAHPA
jgi:hypothetical protein